MPDTSPMLAFLGDHDIAQSFTPEKWSLLFAEARACGLLPRVANDLLVSPAGVSLPSRFKDHLTAAVRQGNAVGRDSRREIEFIRTALGAIETPVLLLKGAAYIAAELPPARGRTFSDIDILVDRSAIPQVESALMLAGWMAEKKDAYDQRYYREWSHEIPPLTHLHRGTTVDLHHSLVMPTCRIKVDSATMIADAVPIPALPGWNRLADEDMVLHAAAHLMLNSEFDRGLRDLGDIDLLIRHFSARNPAFAEKLITRAKQVGLEKLLNCALGICKKIYCTPLPADLTQGGDRTALSWLLNASATTRHPDTRPTMQGMSDMLLAGRELALRFPPSLLMRHLWHKLTAG